VRRRLATRDGGGGERRGGARGGVGLGVGHEHNLRASGGRAKQVECGWAVQEIFTISSTAGGVFRTLRLPPVTGSNHCRRSTMVFASVYSRWQYNEHQV
jgi:hypothetical protein